MKIHHACSSNRGYVDLIGTYSTNERAIAAVVEELGIIPEDAAAYVHEAELDHQLGDN